MNEEMSIEKMFEKFAESAPEIMTRQKIEELTGGLISIKTLTNLDCLGDGITPRLRIGRKVAYPKAAVVAFLKQRAQIF